MSKLVAFAAIQGAYNIVSKAEGKYKRALETYGGSQKLEFPNTAYFLPIIYAAWFKEPKGTWPDERTRERLETRWMLLVPPLVTALLLLGVGLLANAPLSPLEWARLIAEREYGR